MARILPRFDLENYDYPLPEELIASYPTPKREESKLMIIDRKTQDFHFHDSFNEIERYLRAGDLLILNQTKVFPAKFRAKKKTGGRVELLILSKPEGLKFQTEALIKGKRIKPGHELITEEGGIIFRILEDLGEGKHRVELISATKETLDKLLLKEGLVPLPPYIKRPPEDLDLRRYQTVFAKEEGAVAAPTAGLHFSEELLFRLAQKGVIIQYLTLHVGYGTFKPIKTKDIRKHQLEPEYLRVTPKVVIEIESALKEKRRVIACGTTTTRALEYVGLIGLKPYEGLCDLYIYPGYQFKVVSAMITNFHLPKSSLLLLVCAFAGRELIMKAYEEAIKRRYRFYSYGEATFIL